MFRCLVGMVGLLAVASPTALVRGGEPLDHTRPPLSEQPLDWEELQDQETRRESETSVFRTGFLFVDGQYVPPPYVVRAGGLEVDINGRRLVDREIPAHAEPRLRRVLQAESDIMQVGNGIVIGFQGQALYLGCASEPGFSLLQWLAGQLSDPEVQTALHGWATPGQEALWEQWLVDFTPSPQLRQRARDELSRLADVLQDNDASRAAVSRFDLASYPLTLMGMGLCVWAFGHLLRYRPEEPLISNKPVIVTLSLIASLSAIDLVWTVLAHQAGQMTELNPLGGRLIHNVWLLSAFKLGLTGAAVAIFYRLKENAFARNAAWWACLVLTLLLVRWLAVGSLAV